MGGAAPCGCPGSCVIDIKLSLYFAAVDFNSTLVFGPLFTRE